MSKEIWLSPVMGNRRSELIARCRELLTSGRQESFLYLAASYPLLNLITDQLIDGKHIRGVLSRLNVYLFRGLIQHILKTAIDTSTGDAIDVKILIDTEALPLKQNLISRVIRALSATGRLSAGVARSDGYVATISSIIGEIERAGRTPQEFAGIVAARRRDLRIPEKSTSNIQHIDIDHEIAEIYAAYTNVLEQNNLTEEDAASLRAREILRDELNNRNIVLPWTKGLRLLIIDGFFDFTPVQGEILRLLIPNVPNVIVNLNSDDQNREIFRIFHDTIKQLSSIAPFEIKQSKEALPVARSLSTLRERLFNSDTSHNTSHNIETKSSEESDITLFKCSNREAEVRAIAKEIKRLVLIDKYPLSEIALVVRERAAYAKTIIRIFEDEGIPCNLSERKDVLSLPAVRACFMFFEVLMKWALEGADSLKVNDLATLMKSGYFRPSDAMSKGLDTDRIENAIVYVGGELRLNNWLARARLLLNTETVSDDESEDRSEDMEVEEEQIANEDSDEFSLSEFAQDRKERKQKRQARNIESALLEPAIAAVEYFQTLLGNLPLKGEIHELNQALKGLLNALQFEAEVKKSFPQDSSEQELHGITRATLDLRGLDSIHKSLLFAGHSIDLTSHLFSSDATKQTPHLKLTTFLEEVLRLLKNQQITVARARRDGLNVLEATEIRGLRFRAIFVAGLIEGSFPLRVSRDWIYPQDERERLKDYGLVLEDNSTATLLKEEHYFYQVACRATERLYVTYPILLEDGSETVVSSYIEELQRAITPDRINRLSIGPIGQSLDVKAVFDASTLSEASIAVARLNGKRFLSNSAIQRIGIERERAGLKFGPYDGKITNTDLLSFLRKRYGPWYVHSASGLNIFGNCPYKFFLSRLLKLESRPEAAFDLSPTDAGHLIHDVLRIFFERHRRQILNETDLKALRCEIRQIADDLFDEYERRAPPLNSHVWKIDREIRKTYLDRFLAVEIKLHEEVGKQHVTPAYFEVAFGMSGKDVDPISTNQPLELARQIPSSSESSSERMKIRGQIDRIDVSSDNTLIAYDYKLSTGSSRADMEAGRDLQIAVYLAALNLLLPEHKIAGGGYYIIKSSSRNQGLYRESCDDYTGLHPNTSSRFADTEWSELQARVVAHAWDFVDHMRDGDFSVIPSEGKRTCARCDFSSICRYETYRINRKLNR